MKNNFITKFIFIYAVLSKLLTSFYSVLYDTSLHYQDGAIFFSMGRMIMEGKVLYKETFDHKTPYIYFIYGFASLLKERHLGLYIVEVLLFFIILLFIYKTLKLFNYKYAVLVTLALGLFLNSRNFTQGFFKTETCALAVFSPAIYIFSKYFVSEIKKFKLFDMFLIGLFAGFSFMVNIRAIVLFIPYAIVVAFILIKNKEFKNLIMVFIMGILGVFISMLPYLIYMICTDSVRDFYDAVVYTNLAYTDTITKLMSDRMGFVVNFFKRDTFYVLYAIFSLVAIFLIKFNKYLKISIIFSYIIGLYYILFTGKDYLYYFVITVPYFSFGMILLIKIFEKYIGKLCYIKENLNFKLIIIGLLLITISYAASYNVINISNKNCISRSKKLTAMFKNVNIDLKNKKLLALGFEPMVYTLLDITPKYKYFFTPDVSYKLCPEPFKGQVNHVMSLDPDIIVFTTPLKYDGIAMLQDFSVQDCYRMRDVIRTNYSLLGTYDMDEEWGTYRIYIRNSN